MELTIDKRKIDINNRNNLGLSYWDLIFWQNNPIQINNESETANKLNAFIEMELQNLYNYAKLENFTINTQNNPDLDRYFDNQIKSIQARGDSESANSMLSHYIEQKQEYAQTFGSKQFEEYKHLVDFLKNSNYPASFQWLILNEALSSTYRMDFSKDKPRLIVNARKPHQTILGMMNLPSQVVYYIYNNAPNFTNFKQLYMSAQIDFQKVVAQSSGVSFDNVNTFGKGYWIKFDSQQNDPDNFEKNVENLKALVSNTPWCTTTLASTHLSQGDFYVFVDNNNKPHIAIKMTGNAIDEVRGLKKGPLQELEDEYRDVAINFLQNNEELPYGKEWLEKEEWNIRLIQYKKDIDNGTFKVESVGNLFKDILKLDFKKHGGNSNLEDLKASVGKIKPQMAIYFNCNEDEICVGKYQAKEDLVCPYKIIFDNVNFGQTKVKDLGNLQIIIGDVILANSQIQSLGNLNTISGTVYFENSNVEDLGNLTTICGSAYFGHSKVTNLGRLSTIGETVSFKDSLVTNLGELTYIGRSCDFRNSFLTDLGKLTFIGGDAVFKNSKITNLGNLTHIGGDARFNGSKLSNLGNLVSIGENAYFKDSDIKSLGNLTSIGGDADFDGSIVTDLGDLVSIGKNADFRNSLVRDLKNLNSIGSLTTSEEQIKSAKNLKELGLAYILTELGEKELNLTEFKNLVAQNQKSSVHKQKNFSSQIEK